MFRSRHYLGLMTLHVDFHGIYLGIVRQYIIQSPYFDWHAGVSRAGGIAIGIVIQKFAPRINCPDPERRVFPLTPKHEGKRLTV
jgi:hypothetical protein